MRIRSECKRLEAEVISVQTRLYQRDLIRLFLEGLIDGIILDYFSLLKPAFSIDIILLALIIL